MTRLAIQPAHRIRVTSLSGVVTARDLLAAYKRVSSALDYDPRADDLLDLSAVARPLVSAAEVYSLAEYFAQPDRLGHDARLAIVAPLDVVFGLARMYEAYRDASREQIRVYRTRSEAEKWLGLPGRPEA